MSDHEGIKPYQCKLCPSIFAKMSHLNSPAPSIHEEKSPFQCDEILLLFIMENKSVKQFEIDYCGSGFGKKLRMNDHLDLVHGRQSFYKFEVCNKRS